MSTPTDTTTLLNPGAGGDSMDESNVLEPSATGLPTSVGKRPRVVLAGETARESIVEPERQNTGTFALPTCDGEVRALLTQILQTQTRQAEALEALVAAALRR